MLSYVGCLYFPSHYGCIFNVNIDERVKQYRYLNSFHGVVEWLVVGCAGNQISYSTHQGRVMHNYISNIVCVDTKQLAHNNICMEMSPTISICYLEHHTSHEDFRAVTHILPFRILVDLKQSLIFMMSLSRAEGVLSKLEVIHVITLWFHVF